MGLFKDRLVLSIINAFKDDGLPNGNIGLIKQLSKILMQAPPVLFLQTLNAGLRDKDAKLIAKAINQCTNTVFCINFVQETYLTNKGYMFLYKKIMLSQNHCIINVAISNLNLVKFKKA